jgi:FlaA1/EpsC-like NDP-sugar epimerase
MVTVDCIQLVSALEYSKEYHPVGLIDASEELYGNQIIGLDFLY